MQRVLMPFLFVAIAIGLFFSYTRPAYETVQELQAQEERLDKLHTKAIDLKKKYQDLQDQYDSISQQNVTRLGKLIPETIDPVRYIITLDALAEQHNIVLVDFGIPNLAPTQARKSTRTIEEEEATATIGKFTIRSLGSYDNIKQFLASLERSLTLFDVSELTISTLNADADAWSMKDSAGNRIDTTELITDDMLKLNLTIDTYWLP